MPAACNLCRGAGRVRVPGTLLKRKKCPRCAGTGCEPTCVACSSGGCDRQVTALIRPGGERYVLIYTAATRLAAIHQAHRWADDPRLAFDWSDAALMAGRIRRAEEIHHYQIDPRQEGT